MHFRAARISGIKRAVCYSRTGEFLPQELRPVMFLGASSSSALRPSPAASEVSVPGALSAFACLYITVVAESS